MEGHRESEKERGPRVGFEADHVQPPIRITSMSAASPSEAGEKKHDRVEIIGLIPSSNYAAEVTA